MWLLLAQWVVAIVLALCIAPFAWDGTNRTIHPHVYLAVILGGVLNALPLTLIVRRPGWLGTRYSIAVCQMLWSALLIHITGGRIETHFHVFGSLAFLAFYKEWRVLIPATVTVAADHYLRGLLWPQSVYGTLTPDTWRFLEHASWVVFEDIILDPELPASDRAGSRYRRERGVTPSRARSCGGREPREERIPGEHESRDSHADERCHRHDRAAAGYATR